MTPQNKSRKDCSMDAIKKLLGEDLFNKIVEKIGEAKLVLVEKGKEAFIHKADEEVVISNNGEWIPKAKFNDKLDEIKTLKAEAENYKTKLAEASGSSKTVEELQKKVNDLTAEIESNNTESEKRLTTLNKKHALEKSLSKAGAKHPSLLMTKFDLEKIELDGENIKDFDTHLKPVKEEFKDLFGEKKLQGGGKNGKGDPNLDVNLPDGFITFEQFKGMSQKERVANMDKVNESSPHWEQNK